MSTQVEFKSGEVVYQEGSFEMSMYLIKKGVVSVIANYGKENEMLLKDQTEGQYFGHLELVEAIPRSATILAKEDVALEKIQGDEFGAFFTSHPEEQMVILTQMSARLREIGIQLHEVYQTIDEYISDEEKNHDDSFFSKLTRIITFGKLNRE